MSEHSSGTEPGAYGDHSQIGRADAHGHLEPSGHGEHEKPSDWGWNAEFGPWASRAGWAVVVLIGLMFLGITHYNRAGFLAQLLVIAGLVALLLWDRNRKRTSWRD